MYEPVRFVTILFLILTAAVGLGAVSVNLTQFPNKLPAGSAVTITCTVLREQSDEEGLNFSAQWFVSKIGSWNDADLSKVLATNDSIQTDRLFLLDQFGRTVLSFKKPVDIANGFEMQVVINNPLPGVYEWKCQDKDSRSLKRSILKIGNASIETEDNKNITIECDGVATLLNKPNEYQLISVNWIKQISGGVEKPVIQSETEIQEMENTTQTAGILYLYQVQPEDEANYMCKLSYIELEDNETASSTSTTELYIFTKPDQPGEPELRASSSSLLSINWTPSAVRPTRTNKIDNYTLQYIEELYKSYSGWSEGITKSQLITTAQNPYNITQLNPSTKYRVRIKAANSYGEIFSEEAWFETNETAPLLPHINTLKIRTDTMTLMWLNNVDTQVEITAYLLKLKIRNGTNYELVESHSVNATEERSYEFIFVNLTSRTQYCYTIQATNEVGASPVSQCHQFETDLEAPDAPEITGAKQLETQNDTGVLRIQFTPPECIILLLKCANFYNLRYKTEESEEWLERIIDISETDPKMTRRKRNSPMSKELDLGNLELGKKYELELAAVVKSIYYRDIGNKVVYSSPYSPTFTTEQLKISTPIEPGVTRPEATVAPKKDNGVVTIVATVVSVAFVLILIIVIITLVIKKRKGSQDVNVEQNDDYWIDLNTPLLSSPSLGYVENDYENIGIEQWADHVKNMHVDSDIKFSEEYEQLFKTLPSDITNKESLEPANLDKNRYSNVVAYDHSRVPLKTLKTGDLKTDYINANYIDSYDRQRAFIATQGPLPNTIEDFWRMIWEQNCHVIVMITNVYEKHKKKCEQYWPNSGEVTYGRLTVELVDTKETAFWTIRKLKLKSNKASTKKKYHVERNVAQFHFTDWPDHGVPVYTLPVLSFVKRACDANPITAGPIAVHCSAGVGRTGTFIALESMMKQIMQKRTVNVHGFVRHMRSLRNLMVQTEAQYIFIHDALVHFIEGGGRSVEIPIKKIRMSLEELESKFDSSGETHLTKQFKSITKEQPPGSLIAYAKTDALKPKNRSEAFVPLDNATRVKVPRLPGIAGSDYINATYLHGYFQNQEFIITQHPSSHTEFDFWRMVWDQNSMTIVMLSNMGEEDMITFYRPKGEPTMYDNKASFNLKFTDENLSNMDYAERTFLLESNQDDYEMETRMFAITCWPEAYEEGDGEGVFQFIIDVDEWHQSKRNQAGPIIVIDKHGGKVAAQFCALYTLYNQYKNDDVIDIYSLAALYHKKRPGVWQTADDYRFLYTSIVRLCEKVKFDNGGLDRRSESLDQIKDGTPVFAGVRRINTIPRSPERGSKIEDL